MKLSLAARLYIGFIIAAGSTCVGFAAFHWYSPDLWRYCAYLAVALLSSRLRVRLPGITAMMSVNYVFVLLAILDCSYSETILLAGLVMIAQTSWRNRESLLHMAFNGARTAIAATVAWNVFHAGEKFGGKLPLTIAATASIYFVLNSMAVFEVVALTERKKLFRTWKECYFWSFPYCLLGAALAVAISWSNRRFGWEAAVLALPAMYFIYRSYRLYLGKLEAEKLHAEQMAALHLRTIEALALAIEAKDDTTHEHLNRVQVYAVELGKCLALSKTELQALRAASILHDIGKLAVPEHIISKPGKLTHEEFGKMKIHPIVGAEILSRVEFPYPVVPIVRAHHEKWDGSGYPDGLSGDAIPIGARILAAVDCLDALASDRQYRRALPLDDAMAAVAEQSGKSFDPGVVAILQRHYREWEKLARAHGDRERQPLREMKVMRGEEPAAGLEKSASPGDASQPEFPASIAAARQEAQMLYELTQDLGNSLHLHETLSALDNRLQPLIPYDAIAIYVRKGAVLSPAYVAGENFRLFASLEIPIGQGLSGWVAETGKAIINGNPSVEPGYLNDPAKFSTLRSALAVPLETAAGIAGVLALYHAERDAFRQDHLRVLQAINPKISLAIENALKYEEAAISATTDALTTLPNARSLFLHLDAELARAKRTKSSLAVLVCDLDGFKQINDRFGHLEGNKVLKLVAAGMQQNCREYDYVARMGGDEFVLVLSALRPEDLAPTIKRLEQVAHDAGLEVCGEALLAISVGAAFHPGDGDDAESLLAEADRRMYVAKQGHKSRAGNRSADSLLALNDALLPADSTPAR
ncbi:MAG TPA: diguanylate cyclase [Bryobacteraceae bacterium]|nr:diguanylate cyclase [Bryobacteraceae bacterium]